MKRRFAMAPWQAWLLAALLLAAQATGLAHRVAHGGVGGAHAAHQAFSASHDEGSAECRLVDQLAHADALCGGDAPALPALAVRAAEPSRPATRPAAGAPAAYLARAPPRG